MSSIDEFAGDVNGVVADIEAQFKSLSDMKTALSKQANEVAARWSDYFAAQKHAMQKAQDALNRISNVPLSETPKTVPTSGALSQIPKVSNG